MSVFFHGTHRSVPNTFCHRPKLAIVASYTGRVILYPTLTAVVPWCGGDFQLLELTSSWVWLCYGGLRAEAHVIEEAGDQFR